MPTRLFVGYMIFVLLLIVPVSWVIGRRSAWSKFAKLYPAAPSQITARRIWVGRIVIGDAFLKNVLVLRVDDSYLHFSAIALFRLGRPTFSVPWTEISAQPDVWRGLLAYRVMRLTLARNADVRVLVWPETFEKIAAAVGGRLHATG
jgi:hypothetical protein